MNNGNTSATKVLTVLVQITLCVLIAIIMVGLIQQYVFAPIQIEGVSMMPTIKEYGDKVYILKTGYKLNRNDIIIFFRPNSDDVDESDNPAMKKVSFSEFIDSLPIIGGKTTTDDNESEHDFTCVIKRIIGLPGDRIEIIGGKLYLTKNGSSEREQLNDFIMNPYNDSDGTGIRDTDQPVEVGENELYVMGDNRDRSYDSEDYGPINTGWVYGKVVLLNSGNKFSIIK